MSPYSPAWLDTSRNIGADVQQLVKSGFFLTRVVVERLVDDLDDATETLDFSYRGVDYQIDLSARNARALDKLLAPYLEVSRRSVKRSAIQRPVAKAPSAAPVAKAVRAWAKNQGIEVSDRGRVPTDVMNRYHDPHRS
jgi:nucleoid-associated protein Lsr2